MIFSVFGSLLYENTKTEELLMEHDVYNDLLYLYADDLCSEKTKAFVGEHLKTCADCREKLAGLRDTVHIGENPDTGSAGTLKKINRRIRKHNAAVICAVEAVTLVLVVLIFGAAAQPGDEMGFSLVSFYLLIPAAGLVSSLICARNGKKWVFVIPAAAGLIDYVLPYFFFHTTEVIMFCFACGASLAGLLIGLAVRAIKNRKHR